MTRRFLCVVPPLAGHVNPTISVARALQSRGHRVAWVGYPLVRQYLPPDAELIPLEGAMSEGEWERLIERSRGVRGLESFQFVWEEVLLPLARAMMPGVERVIAAERPDVLMVDHQAIAGALVARKMQLPWATLCTTSASVVDTLSDLPKVRQWVARQLAELEVRAGLPSIASPDLSPSCVIVFSTEALVGNERAWPSHYRFVGPSIVDRPDSTPFPWDSLAAKPRVFVSLGTVSAEVGAPFYATMVQALRDLDAQVIVAAPPHLVPEPPESFLVQARVPQLRLLPHVQAVVCHGGHNTVCESLANGLPLVVAPIRDDQPVVAQQVRRAGAGIRVRYGRLTPVALREAVQSVLREPRYREAARRIADSFAAAGGAAAAADALERLA
jgi:MGT family glycosyltransferase